MKNLEALINELKSECESGLITVNNYNEIIKDFPKISEIINNLVLVDQDLAKCIIAVIFGETNYSSNDNGEYYEIMEKIINENPNLIENFIKHVEYTAYTSKVEF